MNPKQDRYRETIKLYSKLGQKYIQGIARVLPCGFIHFVKLLPKRGLVLDVGCAGGRDSKRFIQKGFRVVGIDLVDVFLREARKKVPRVKFIKMDMCKLKFPEQYFDAIWAHAVLLHAKKKDVPKILKGFYRVLKPCGKLYIGVKKGRGTGYKKEKLSGGQKRLFTYFLEDELKKFVEKAAFKIIALKICPDELGRKNIKWIIILAGR